MLLWLAEAVGVPKGKVLGQSALLLQLPKLEAAIVRRYKAIPWQAIEEQIR